MEESKKKEFDDEINKMAILENEILERILQNTEAQKKIIEDFQKSYSLGNDYSNRNLDSLNTVNYMSLNNNHFNNDSYTVQIDDYGEEKDI